jgi:tRNA(Glu) U13 pseudouridine synthase TruD
MEITLTGPEKFVLRETLEKAIKEMLMEIAHTDNRKMREGLKEREEILKGILEKLPAEVCAVA